MPVPLGSCLIYVIALLIYVVCKLCMSVIHNQAWMHQRMFQQKLTTLYRRCATCNLWIPRIQYRSMSSEEKIHAKSESTTTELPEKPIAYSSSKAAVWQARYTFGDVPEDKKPPEAQSIVAVISVAVFLVYFCILREENDIDVELAKTLNDRVEGFDEVNLHVGGVDKTEDKDVTSQ